jgi:hypothetical protein
VRGHWCDRACTQIPLFALARRYLRLRPCTPIPLSALACRFLRFRVAVCTCASLSSLARRCLSCACRTVDARVRYSQATQNVRLPTVVLLRAVSLRTRAFRVAHDCCQSSRAGLCDTKQISIYSSRGMLALVLEAELRRTISVVVLRIVRGSCVW